MAKIYILKHPDSRFKGFIHGVGFDEGVGSTSSERDRNFCVNKKCRDITEEYWERKRKEEVMAKAREAKKTKNEEKGKEKAKKEEEAKAE